MLQPGNFRHAKLSPRSDGYIWTQYLLIFEVRLSLGRPICDLRAELGASPIFDENGLSPALHKADSYRSNGIYSSMKHGKAIEKDTSSIFEGETSS